MQNIRNDTIAAIATPPGYGGIGVIRALEAQGFEPGDEVEIAGVVFDLDPEG